MSPLLRPLDFVLVIAVLVLMLWAQNMDARLDEWAEIHHGCSYENGSWWAPAFNGELNCDPIGP